VLVDYIEAGVAGFVVRDGSLLDVMASVESASRGEALVPPRLVSSLFSRLATLERERFHDRQRQTADAQTQAARVAQALGRYADQVDRATTALAAALK
jgi:DNA-binding NarL/FixJ family response regulator